MASIEQKIKYWAARMVGVPADEIARVEFTNVEVGEDNRTTFNIAVWTHTDDFYEHDLFGGKASNLIMEIMETEPNDL